MENQYIQWTYEGELKTAKLELGETCSITELKKVEAKRFEVKDEEAINYGKQKPLEKAPKYKEVAKEEGGCSSCEENKRRNGLMHLAKGGAKLLKAQLGMDASDEDTINERKALCLSCKHYDFGVCNSCGCFCSAKVRLKTEKCPIGIW